MAKKYKYTGIKKKYREVLVTKEDFDALLEKTRDSNRLEESSLEFINNLLYDKYLESPALQYTLLKGYKVIHTMFFNNNVIPITFNRTKKGTISSDVLLFICHQRS